MESDSDAVEAEPEAAENMTLFGVRPESIMPFTQTPAQDAACNLGLAVADHAGFEAGLDHPGLREVLADSSLPKDVQCQQTMPGNH